MAPHWPLHPDAVRLAGLPFEGRRTLAGIPEGVLLRGSVTVISPGLKIRFSALGEEDPPCRFKRGSRFPEGRSGALAGTAARVEAASPAPAICGGRVAGAQADRADMDIAIKDQPSLLAGVRIASAAQGGHGQ
jgi:hypothetical protein